MFQPKKKDEKKGKNTDAPVFPECPLSCTKWRRGGKKVLQGERKQSTEKQIPQTFPL